MTQIFKTNLQILFINYTKVSRHINDLLIIKRNVNKKINLELNIRRKKVIADLDTYYCTIKKI